MNKLLIDAENDVKKVCWYCKDCKSCERFYSIRSEFKKKVFQCLTKILNIGMLEIMNNLKSELLEILNSECNFFVCKPSGPLENASVMVLTKEATDNDRSLKTQLTISSKSSKEKISSERVWSNEGFFKDTKPELKLEKKYTPENALFYINQLYISTVKNGDLVMYHHNFIIGQLYCCCKSIC